ncbi:HCLS1-associated protein X-1 [Pseudomyrmex gracilis]|uniref:HCLS1-associated protein X-1 n=1 Tax=Pseudomyrmex gracilis TaxID=219809 RepID=UPI00099558A8|nr:HCLS1-associated protein X-1 [Pseudomyrmex gracilis]
MSLFDYFRNFLGAKRRNEPGTSGLDEHYAPRDNFRNPIWQSDDDDDEIDIDEFMFNGNNMHFNIFSDPLEMAKYFESQMDNMLKNFGFGHNSFFRMLPGIEEDIKALPFAEHEPERNIDIDLREKMLKSKPEIFGEQNHEQKIDTDVDGKITTEEFSKLWNKGSLETVKPSAPHSFSFGRSVRKEIVRNPDGTIEEKQVIRDSKGNEETIISRVIGDKRYVVTTKKDKNGFETKSEDLFNIDENELKEFTQKWKPKSDTDTNQPILSRFPWDKFFGFPNPKL